VRGDLTLNKDYFEAYFDQLENDLDAVARGVVITFWNLVLVNTPQWTGAMAASWNFTYNTIQPVDRHDMVQDREATPHQKGHPIGIDIANAESYTNLSKFKLGDVAWVSNGVSDIHANYYAQEIEDGTHRLRAVNRPGNAVSMSLAIIDARFGSGIKLSTAKQLMKLKVE
jgi:hypothetical protein